MNGGKSTYISGRVLVAAHSPSWRHELRRTLDDCIRMLHYWGHETQEVHTEDAALATLTTFDPDVLVVDWLLTPGLVTLVRNQRHRNQIRKPAVIFVATVSAEAGALIALPRKLPDVFDSIMFKPYLSNMSEEDQARYRVHVAFQEELLANIGLHLARLGISPNDPHVPQGDREPRPSGAGASTGCG
jgi:hypothetical protein